MTQVCSHCKVAKPLESFAPSKRNKAHAWCKDCQREARKKPEILAHDHEVARKRRQQPEIRQQITDRMRNYHKRPEQKPTNAVRQRSRRHLLKHAPEKCQRCGAVAPLQRHHKSYNNPESYLDVEWLCVECHRKEH